MQLLFLASELLGEMDLDSQKTDFLIALLETECVQLFAFYKEGGGSLSWGTSGFRTA